MTDPRSRIPALIRHADLAVVRQGVELHRTLLGPLPDDLWRIWQGRELYDWLTRIQPPSPAPLPEGVQITSPRQLHRVCLQIARYSALSRRCTILSSRYSADSATVTFRLYFQGEQNVTLHTEGSGLTWTLG